MEIFEIRRYFRKKYSNKGYGLYTWTSEQDHFMVGLEVVDYFESSGMIWVKQQEDETIKTVLGMLVRRLDLWTTVR